MKLLTKDATFCSATFPYEFVPKNTTATFKFNSEGVYTAVEMCRRFQT